MSENYQNTNGFYGNEYKQWRKLYDVLNLVVCNTYTPNGYVVLFFLM